MVASKPVLTTPAAVLEMDRWLRETKLHHYTRNRELSATARSKDMPVDLTLLKLSLKNRKPHLAKIKYLFICRQIRVKSAISKSKRIPINSTLQLPPRHQLMILAPMVATLTSRISIWPKMLPFHPSPKPPRVISSTHALVMGVIIIISNTVTFILTTASEPPSHLWPGRWPTTPLTSVMTSQATQLQLRPPAHRRKGSTTKRSDSNSTRKSKRWKRLKCAETSLCTSTANMVMLAATLTTSRS